VHRRFLHLFHELAQLATIWLRPGPAGRSASSSPASSSTSRVAPGDGLDRLGPSPSGLNQRLASAHPRRSPRPRERDRVAALDQLAPTLADETALVERGPRSRQQGRGRASAPGATDAIGAPDRRRALRDGGSARCSAAEAGASGSSRSGLARHGERVASGITDGGRRSGPDPGPPEETAPSTSLRQSLPIAAPHTFHRMTAIRTAVAWPRLRALVECLAVSPDLVADGDDRHHACDVPASSARIRLRMRLRDLNSHLGLPALGLGPGGLVHAIRAAQLVCEQLLRGPRE